ncbi:3-carboxy-cis,cis-mucoante lactonizing enzyme [Multifurca ochricompacta]|uniref:3-carboxy-cis,cis-mucoante lactonizing enzyme n=1 Tax=Multifurca ochricompacta TaxID=376703 RepID=A0AAD4M853_9AGAM|nr:3-carboxy-cis,cis-mucoante lactonizing enzyme [Multifurca ochricompacta]
MTGYRIIVGSYTDRITSLFFDPAGPTLKVTSEIKVGNRPSWLAAHPDDSSLVFACLEQDDGVAIALRFDEEGTATIVGQIPSGGKDPASLLAIADTLLVGNYSSGTILTAPQSTSPPYFPAYPPSALLQLNGTGPDLNRQMSSHPHHIVSVPGRAELLIPDLGADRTWRVTHDQLGQLTVQGEVSYPPGSGPRHVVFHEDILYTVNELTNTVTAHRLPPLPAEPTLLSTTSTFQHLPEEFLGDRFAAELLFAPTLTGDNQDSPSILYASNRNDPAGDTLAILSLQRPDVPELIGEVQTGLKHLRGAALGGENGRWVVLGGVLGGGVKLYERIDGGRSLREIATLPQVEAPTAFLWLR